jgi:hypothetical protein
MKYLLNLPLALAALLQAWFVGLVVMPSPWPGWEDGPSRGAMVLVMLEPVVLAWLLIGISIFGVLFAGGFDWLPIRRRWLRIVVVLGGSMLVAIFAAPCVFAAMATSAAVGVFDAEPLPVILRLSGTFAVTVVPFVVIGWLAWLIDAPPRLRDAAPFRLAVAIGMAIAVISGGFLAGEALSDEIRVSRATSERYREWEDADKATLNAEYAKASDADRLFSWRRYTDRFAPKDMRQAALQRLARRPTLEANLAAALASSDADESDYALFLVQQVQFTPSAALEAPLREAISRISHKIRTVREPGSGNDFGSYLDDWFGEHLAAALAAARKMADGPGVDLRGSLHELQDAVIAAYPDSKAAKTYPKQVAALEKHIDATLAAHPKAG